MMLLINTHINYTHTFITSHFIYFYPLLFYFFFFSFTLLFISWYNHVLYLFTCFLSFWVLLKISFVILSQISPHNMTIYFSSQRFLLFCYNDYFFFFAFHLFMFYLSLFCCLYICLLFYVFESFCMLLDFIQYHTREVLWEFLSSHYLF